MVACRACLETNKEMRSLDEPFAIQYNLLTELKVYRYNYTSCFRGVLSS